MTPARTLSLFLILASLLAASCGPPPTEGSPGPSPQASSRAEAAASTPPAEKTMEETTSAPKKTVEGTVAETTSAAPEKAVKKTEKKEPEPKQEPAEKIVEVEMQGLLYLPGPVTVSPGTPVRWVNKDQALHTVTSEGSGGPLASEELGRGDSYEYTFREPGQYDYYCVVHPFMKSGVTVE